MYAIGGSLTHIFGRDDHLLGVEIISPSLSGVKKEKLFDFRICRILGVCDCWPQTLDQISATEIYNYIQPKAKLACRKLISPMWPIIISSHITIIFSPAPNINCICNTINSYQLLLLCLHHKLLQ